ncbi:hypothetical protein DSLASN_20450 [Desulfoluna limicola]|uniref:Uncharacterized protein n=1 Tax=Desulfoluna limicola TaxID=2810562 RepID=A0ABM7PH66_9BACT|nr:hypothetical protein DSLASN_20450 [Desulfoluna limicola]
MQKGRVHDEHAPFLLGNVSVAGEKPKVWTGGAMLSFMIEYRDALGASVNFDLKNLAMGRLS